MQHVTLDKAISIVNAHMERPCLDKLQSIVIERYHVGKKVDVTRNGDMFTIELYVDKGSNWCKTWSCTAS